MWNTKKSCWSYDLDDNQVPVILYCGQFLDKTKSSVWVVGIRTKLMPNFPKIAKEKLWFFPNLHVCSPVSKCFNISIIYIGIKKNQHIFIWGYCHVKRYSNLTYGHCHMVTDIAIWHKVGYIQKNVSGNISPSFLSKFFQNPYI